MDDKTHSGRLKELKEEMEEQKVGWEEVHIDRFI